MAITNVVDSIIESWDGILNGECDSIEFTTLMHICHTESVMSVNSSWWSFGARITTDPPQQVAGSIQSLWRMVSSCSCMMTPPNCHSMVVDSRHVKYAKCQWQICCGERGA